MNIGKTKWHDREIGTGMRIAAALLAILCIGAGVFGTVRGVSEGPWYMAAVGIAVIFYGILWANIARTGHPGRIPLWL